MKPDGKLKKRVGVSLSPELVAYVDQFKAMTGVSSRSKAIEILLLKSLHDEAYVTQVEYIGDRIDQAVTASTARLAKLIYYAAYNAGAAREASLQLIEWEGVGILEKLAEREPDQLTLDMLEAYTELDPATQAFDVIEQFMKKHQRRVDWEAKKRIKHRLPQELRELVDELTHVDKRSESGADKPIKEIEKRGAAKIEKDNGDKR